MKYFINIIFLFYSMFCYSQSGYVSNILIDGIDPSYSPDGKFIVCSRGGIWIVNIQTKEKRKISSLNNCCRPRWSPDGNKIVFQSYGYGSRFSIWIVDINGENQHKFIDAANEEDQSPYWSPNGKNIAWTHGKQIWIADSNGKHAKPLTKESAKEWEYITDWSKDSKTIMYLRNDDYSSGTPYFVWFIDIDGNNQKAIIPKLFTNCAKYSKDEKSIYFLTYDYDQKVNCGTCTSLNYGTVNYLNKFYFSDNMIFRRINKIILDNCNNLLSYNLSPDFHQLLFDNVGPETDPNIFIRNLEELK